MGLLDTFGKVNAALSGQKPPAANPGASNKGSYTPMTQTDSVRAAYAKMFEQNDARARAAQPSNSVERAMHTAADKLHPVK